jgi:NAD(P)H-dependent flavin oxidoreductase YrpB (nitropropane dioxygenase family)
MTTLHTPLCDLLEIEIPILQAGMGRGRGSTTPVAMVAAVSEAGGLGCLGATGMDPEEIRAAIREIRSLTSKPFGVDLLLPASLADADVPREQVRQQIRREHPEHWKFMLGLYERFGLDPNEQHDQEWALSPTLMRRQADVLIEEKVPVFASGLGDPAWVVRRNAALALRSFGPAGELLLNRALREQDAFARDIARQTLDLPEVTLPA